MSKQFQFGEKDYRKQWKKFSTSRYRVLGIRWKILVNYETEIGVGKSTMESKGRFNQTAEKGQNEDSRLAVIRIALCPKQRPDFNFNRLWSPRKKPPRSWERFIEIFLGTTKRILKGFLIQWKIIWLRPSKVWFTDKNFQSYWAVGS